MGCVQSQRLMEERAIGNRSVPNKPRGAAETSVSDGRGDSLPSGSHVSSFNDALNNSSVAGGSSLHGHSRIGSIVVAAADGVSHDAARSNHHSVAVAPTTQDGQSILLDGQSIMIADDNDRMQQGSALERSRDASGNSRVHSTLSSTRERSTVDRSSTTRLTASIAPSSGDRETTILSTTSSGESCKSILLYDDDRFQCCINGRNGYELEEIYEEHSGSPMLGRGQYGYVYRRSHLYQENTHVAVKMTKPTLLDLRAGPIDTYDDVVDKCQEVRTLLRLRGKSNSSQCHLHIMQLYEFFWNGTDLNLVLELLPMNLREWMLQQRSFPEEQAKEAARSILSGLKAMGEHNIVHRDIKEENIMFGVVNDLQTLKICDFGFAQDLSNTNESRIGSSRSTAGAPPHTTTGICGSLGYLAPEIYANAPYGTCVDIFSFGVLLYRILSAEKPWPDTPRIATQLATLQLQYSMDSERWQPVSSHGRGLVRRLLTYHTERITASEALRHEWFGEQSMSILMTDPSFPANGTRCNSGTIILEDESYQFNETSADDAICYWIHENMHHAVSRLVESACFHGQIRSREGGYMLVEERFVTDRYALLPKAIARLPVYTELECRNVFRQIVLQVGRFHQTGLAHRCLHTESIVVASGSQPNERTVHLRGINYAQLCSTDRPITGRVGDSDKAFEWFAFKAPEIDSAFTHDSRVDLWSLGVLLYTMLCGVGPFYGERRDIFSRKAQGVILYELFEPSDAAKALIRGLIQVDPSRRLRIDEILNHEWMTAPDAELSNCGLDIAQITFLDWYKEQ